MKICIGRLVRCRASNLFLKVGDIGLVDGPSTSKARQGDVRVSFTGGVAFNMTVDMIQPAHDVWGLVGSVVYSRISHKDTQPGDAGTIVGPSSDPSKKDHVLVQFGNNMLNLLPAHVSARQIADSASSKAALRSSLTTAGLAAAAASSSAVQDYLPLSSTLRSMMAAALSSSAATKPKVGFNLSSLHDALPR